MNLILGAFLALLVVFSSASVVPAADPNNLLAERMTAKQVRHLLYGNTAEVVFVKSKQKGLLYFSPNGEFKQLKGARLSKGYWKVRNNGRLCTNLEGNSWSCRTLVAEGDSFRQYVVKKNGKHRHELTIKKLHSGRKLAKLARTPILPPGTLTARQMIKLFSDRTVETVTANKGRVSLTYYAADGNVEQLRNGNRRFGKWRVRKDDRFCLQMGNLKEKCRIIVKQGKQYKKYIVKKNGRHQHSISYRKFSPGKRF